MKFDNFYSAQSPTMLTNRCASKTLKPHLNVGTIEACSIPMAAGKRCAAKMATMLMIDRRRNTGTMLRQLTQDRARPIGLV